MRIDKLDAQLLDAINSMYANGENWKYISNFLHNEVDEAIGMYQYEIEKDDQKSLKQLLFPHKLLKKGSKAAKAWGAKMRRLRGGGTKRKKSTRKGQRRKTARRAYEGIKRKARKSYKRRKSSSGMKMPRVPSVIKKVAIGVGAASLAGMAVGLIAPQFSGIARPIAALAAGGIPGVAGELLINQGLLQNITGIFGGASINDTRLAGGL